MNKLLIGAIAASILLATGCGRNIRTARDITPGNPSERQLDWKYGANDIRVQTSKVIKSLMDRWYASTQYHQEAGKPRIVVSQVENRTDQYLSSDMVRDIFESCSVDDGRFAIVVGDVKDEKELDLLMQKVQTDGKYSNSSKLTAGQAKAPQFLAKVRLTKAITHQKFFDIEDYRMTVTLYDVETQEAVDSAYDVLRKQVKL